MLCYLRLGFAAADEAAEAASELLIVGALCVRQGIVATPHLHSVAQCLSSAQHSSCTSEPVPSCPKSLMPQASTSPALLEQACISHCPARLGLGTCHACSPRVATHARSAGPDTRRCCARSSLPCARTGKWQCSALCGEHGQKGPLVAFPPHLSASWCCLMERRYGGGLPDRSRRTAALCSTAASMCSVSV